jgi:hypothetical protein
MKLYSPGDIDNNKQMKLYSLGYMSLNIIVLQAAVSLNEVTHSSSFLCTQGIQLHLFVIVFAPKGIQLHLSVIVHIHSHGCIDNNRKMKLYSPVCIDNNKQMKL